MLLKSYLKLTSHIASFLSLMIIIMAKPRYEGKSICGLKHKVLSMRGRLQSLSVETYLLSRHYHVDFQSYCRGLQQRLVHVGNSVDDGLSLAASTMYVTATDFQLSLLAAIFINILNFSYAGNTVCYTFKQWLATCCIYSEGPLVPNSILSPVFCYCVFMVNAFAFYIWIIGP